MKQAVVFYSQNGNTRVAAQAMGKKFGADLFELEEVKKRSTNFFGFMYAGYSAGTGQRSEVKDTFAKEMKSYKKIYVGSPVWAAKAVPAVNTFLDALDVKGKEIVLFTVQADQKDGPPSKGMAKLADALKARGAKVSSVVRLSGAERMKDTVAAKDMKARVDAKM